MLPPSGQRLCSYRPQSPQKSESLLSRCGTAKPPAPGRFAPQLAAWLPGRPLAAWLLLGAGMWGLPHSLPGAGAAPCSPVRAGAGWQAGRHHWSPAPCPAPVTSGFPG